VKPTHDIEVEKMSFRRILCDATKEKQQAEREIEEAMLIIKNAKEMLQQAKENLATAELQMIQAEKCCAMLNEVKSITLAKLELGGF
jgi:hypothetical protein